MVRVWDMRTKQSIYTLSGHTGTVMKLQMQTLMPHIVSGSQDKMVNEHLAYWGASKWL